MPDHLTTAQRRLSILEREALILAGPVRPLERRSTPRVETDPGLDLRAAREAVARLEGEVAVLTRRRDR